MIGVDLSPYFISMANFRLKEQADLLVRIHVNMSQPMLNLDTATTPCVKTAVSALAQILF